jgi:hypothetical protein
VTKKLGETNMIFFGRENMWHWDGPSPIDGNLDFHRKKRCTE